MIEVLQSGAITHPLGSNMYGSRQPHSCNINHRVTCKRIIFSARPRVYGVYRAHTQNLVTGADHYKSDILLSQKEETMTTMSLELTPMMSQMHRLSSSLSSSAFRGSESRQKTRNNTLLVGSDNLSCASLAVLVSSALTDLGGNHIFMSAFWSWLIAQVAKLFTAWYREGKWDYKVMFDSGGMPSSHTALVVGLTTSIAYQFGLGSAYFPISLAFTLIVMYDAAGVRRHAGKQAEVLNRIVEDMFHGSAISNTKLKEVLGHSPLQVMCGAILGVAVGTFYMLRCT